MPLLYSMPGKGDWIDGGHEAGYVVEFEAVPEPSSTHWLMAGAAFGFCLLKKVSFKLRSRTILLQSKTSV